MSPRVNQRQIAQVLLGTGPYDELSEQEQAIVRQGWTERMKSRRESLNYREQFSAAGESYSELDEDGSLVVRSAG